MVVLSLIGESRMDSDKKTRSEGGKGNGYLGEEHPS